MLLSAWLKQQQPLPPKVGKHLISQQYDDSIDCIISRRCRLATITTTSTTTTGSFPHQCSVYTVYNDATRHVSPAGGSTCDQTIFSTTFSTWVRFIGIGGTEIPRSATNASRCGTSYTGWYMGTMPTTSMTVVGMVCYASTTSDCFIFNSIVVTNCESFYVYGLIDPPVCNSRYCII